MKKTVALVLLALAPALAGAAFDTTTYLYSGTETASAFRQYCYTNGTLCVIQDRRDKVVEPAELVLRKAGVVNTYENVRVPPGMRLSQWVLDVKSQQTISQDPPRKLSDVNPAAVYTGQKVSIPGSGVSFTHWDMFLLLMPCFTWVQYDLVYEMNDGSGNYRRDMPSLHTATEEVEIAACLWRRTGYDFTGWSRTSDGPGEFQPGVRTTGLGLDVKTDGVFRLYASWKKRDMTVALDPCGGTVPVESVIARIDEPLALPTPEREHYDFLGWFTQESGGWQIEDGAPVTRDDLQTLHAQWRVQSHGLTVGTATPHFGSVRPSGDLTREYGTELSLEAEPYDGYEFVRWNDGSTNALRTVTVTSNAVYWARFAPAAAPSPDPGPEPEEEGVQTVYFLPNGGSGQMAPQTFKGGETTALSTNGFVFTNRVIETMLDGVVTNHVPRAFLGWAASPTATTNEIVHVDGECVTDPAPDGWLALYAVWEPVPEFEPVPEPKPEPVTLTTDTVSDWSPSGEGVWEANGGDAKSLRGTVTGPGTLTFSWKGGLMLGGIVPYKDQNVCRFTGGTNVIRQLKGDAAWHTETWTVTESGERVLEWLRLDSQVSVKDVTWTATVLPPPVIEPVAAPAQACFHVAGPLVYDGSEQTGVVSVAGCTLTNATATAAGDYEAVATLDPDAVWSDGFEEASRSVSWSIARGVKDMSGVSFTNVTAIADGTVWRLTVAGELPEGVTVSYDDEGHAECGIWTVTASFTCEDDGYDPIPDMTATLRIVWPFGPHGDAEPGAGELPEGALSLYDVSFGYDGEPHGPSAAVLMEAFAPYIGEGRTFGFAEDPSAAEDDWSDVPPTLTDVGTKTVWYRVNTSDTDLFVHALRVTIEPRDLSLVTVAPIPDQEWTGEACEPVPEVTDEELSATVTPADYTLSYTNNVGSGLATVVLTGRRNYCGTLTADFTIGPADYDMSGVLFTNAVAFADGGPHDLLVTGTLPEGVSVSYSGGGYTEPGAYVVTAHFTGDANHKPIPDMTATLTLVSLLPFRQFEPMSIALDRLGLPPIGPKATVKAEGLPSGLKLAKTPAGWVLSGTPGEPLDGETRRAYVRITENKVQALLPLRICVLPVEAERHDSIGVYTIHFLPAAASVSKLPTGIRFQEGICSGTPTKAGVFSVLMTMRDKTKQTFYWVIDPPVVPQCQVRIDSPLPQQDAKTVIRQGVAYDWPVEVTEGASVAASGLPAGLKLVKTPVKENGKIVRYVYALAGAPTKDGEFVVTFKTKLGAVTTVTTEAFSVRPLPAWAVGTFNGGGADGQVALTVSKVGKLSGKWQSGGLAWTLSAPAFAGYDETDGTYAAELVMKAGKLVQTNAVVLAAGSCGGTVTGPLFTADQNNWKLEPWKTAGKAFAKAAAVTYAPFERDGDTVSLKAAAAGTVTVKGSFVIGENPKTGAPVRYAASCSAVLCPLDPPEADGTFSARVFIHFPPKPDKLPDGYTACVTIRWDGTDFTVEEIEETLPL